MRFWIALIVLALVNLVGWMVDWNAVLHRRPALAVAPDGFVMDGEVATAGAGTGTEIRLRFDHVMATAGDPAPGAFSPAIAGRWRWDDDRTLVFRADAPLAAATRYTLALDRERVAAGDGCRLPAGSTLRFHTAPLRLLDARIVDRDDGDRSILALRFNQPVVPQEAARAIRLTHPDGSPMPVEAAGDAPDTEVRLRTAALPVSDSLVLGVHLPQGFAGTAGPLGLEADVDRRITLTSQLCCTAATLRPRASAGPAWDLTLAFNRPIRPEALLPLLSVSPAVAWTPVSGDDAVPTAFDPAAPTSWLQLRGDFVQGVRYALSIAAAPGAAAARLPQPATLYASVPDYDPSCHFAESGGHLGSQGNRSLAIQVVNLRQVRVRAWRLYDSNLVTWRTSHWIQRLEKPLTEKLIAVDAAPNHTATVRLGIDELLGAHAGDGVYRFEVGADRHDVILADWHGWLSSDDCVVSLSDLALSARQGRDGLLVWATSLASGRPVGGVRVALFSAKQQALGTAVSGADGIASIATVHPDADDQAAIVVADRADAGGLTWLDLREGDLRDAWAQTGGRPWGGQEAFVHPDRGLIRPGETAHWRAIVRAADGAVPAPFPVRWQVWRPDGRSWSASDAALDGDGCASLDLALPDAAMTGRWRIALTIPGGSELGSEGLLVEDVIPDRLAVAMDLPGSGDVPRLGAGPQQLTVHGDWLFGAPAAGCAATLALRLDPGSFSAEAWRGWWNGDAADAGAEVGLAGEAVGSRLPDLAPATIAADGRAVFSIDPAAAITRLAARAVARPWRLTATASVLEAGGRAVSAGRSAIVDPVPAYLLLRPGTCTAGAPCPVELRLVQPDGALAADAANVELRLFKVRWETVVARQNGRYTYTSNRVLTAVGPMRNLDLAAGAGATTVTVPDGGTYILLADVPGSALAVSGYLSAAGGDAWTDSIARERPEHAEVAPAVALPDDGVAPGTTVAFDIKSPFAGTLLLAIATDRVVETRVVELAAPATRVEVVADPAWGGTAYVTATIIRKVEPDRPWQVHRAYGVCPLRITQAPRQAVVTVTAPGEVRPGATLACAALVTDPAGAPLPDAAVTIAAVDEGILRPAAFRTPDPFAFFCGKRLLGVEANDVYGDLMPELPRSAALTPGGDEAVAARHLPPVSVRRVVPVALWSGVVRTGADGRALAAFTVPESFSGMLRVMAVAAAGTRVGSAAAPCAVRAPVLVQASLPRFLAPGDRCRVPVTVFNQGEAAEATVQAMATGAATASPASQALAVPAHGSAIAWVELSAAAAMGPAAFTAEARIGDEHHRERTALAVRPAAAVATVGGSLALVPGRAVALPVPAGFLAGGWREARIAIEPAPDLGIPLAIERLLTYPHGCAEQTTAAGLALVRLPEFLPPAARPAVAERLQAGFEHLRLMTTRDGGLAMWPGGRDAWPWASIFALHLLHEAADAGFAVPAGLRDGLIGYAKGQLGRSDADQLATRCYAVHVLALQHQPQPVALARLAEEVRRAGTEAPPECVLHLAAAWLAAGDRTRAAALVPAAIAPRSGRSDGGDCGSGTRDRAMALLTLAELDPQRPEAVRLARELADPERWYSTQDTAWAVLALGRWRATVHPLPYASAELRAGDHVLAAGAGAQAWTGTALPDGLSATIDGAAGATGWLAWSAAGVPASPPAPASAGLHIERSWSPPPGKLRRGDLVTVTLRITSPDRQARRNVVVEDLLPAGIEIENPRLATSAGQGATAAAHDPTGSSPDHIEIRDDRLVAVGDLPAGGALVHSYLARAVAAGTFALPAPVAECMYDRSVHAVGDGGTLTIRER